MDEWKEILWLFVLLFGPGIELRALYMLGQQYAWSSLTFYIEMTLTKLPKLALNCDFPASAYRVPGITSSKSCPILPILFLWLGNSRKYFNYLILLAQSSG